MGGSLRKYKMGNGCFVCSIQGQVQEGVQLPVAQALALRAAGSPASHSQPATLHPPLPSLFTSLLCCPLGYMLHDGSSAEFLP